MLKTIAIAAAVIMMGAVPTTMASKHCNVPTDCSAHCASAKKSSAKAKSACDAGCKAGLHLKPSPCSTFRERSDGKTCKDSWKSMSRQVRAGQKCLVTVEKNEQKKNKQKKKRTNELKVQEAAEHKPTAMEKMHESKMAHGSKDSLETHAAYNAGQEHRYDPTLSTGEKGTVGNIESAQRDHHTTKPAHTRDNKAPIIGDDSHHLSALERMHKRATDHGKKDHVHPAL